MNTLRIENRVHNYDSWRQTFDKFDALRREKGRAYRVSRPSDDPLRVFIDLDFDSPTRAEDFRETLAKIWRTPQSRDQLADHVQPLVLDILAGRSLPHPGTALDTDTARPDPPRLTGQVTNRKPCGAPPSWTHQRASVTLLCPPIWADPGGSGQRRVGRRRRFGCGTPRPERISDTVETRGGQCDRHRTGTQGSAPALGKAAHPQPTVRA